MPVNREQLKKGTRVQSLNFGWMEAVSDPYPSGLPRGDFRIDARFDDTGSVREGIIDRYFLGGYVRDGSVEANMSIGARYNTFECGVVEIVENPTSKNLYVRFLDTGNIQKVELDPLVKGIVSDRQLMQDKQLEHSRLKDEKRAEEEKLKSERARVAAEIKAARDKYLAERNAKRDAENNGLAAFHKHRADRRAEKLANLDDALKVVKKELNQEKVLDDIVNVDFKDRDGNWVLRFSMNGKFMQTRLGKLHNNLTQRVKKDGSYSTFSGAYKDVTISEVFQDPQKFCDWAVQQPGWGIGYHLEKDLLSGENKIYSESTCAFLPAEINTALIQPRKTVVYRTADGYHTLHLRLGGKEVSVPGFETRDEAMNAYCKYREAFVRKLATEYREAISERAYEALMTWKLKVPE